MRKNEFETEQGHLYRLTKTTLIDPWSGYKLSLKKLKAALQSCKLGRMLYAYMDDYNDNDTGWDITLTRKGALSVGCRDFTPAEAAPILKAAGFSLARAKAKAKRRSKARSKRSKR